LSILKLYRKIAIENLAILQTGDLPAILRCRHIFALHRIGHIRLIAKMDSASSGSQLASFPKNQCLFLGSNRLWKNSLSSMKKHVRGFPTYYEAVSQCHCEGAKRPKQSHNILKIKRLPRSLRSLAMTKWALRHSLYEGDKGGGLIAKMASVPDRFNRGQLASFPKNQCLFLGLSS